VGDSPEVSVNNADVAAAMSEIAELLELKGESSFRIRAYENAARTLGNLPEDIRTVAAEGRLRDIKGVGEALALKINELLDTGHLTYLDNLRAEFPAGVRTLMSVPGVGPSLARRAYQELGIDSLDGLRAAAESGVLASLPGFGEKSAENLLRALGRVKKRENRISIGRAIPLVEELMDALRPHAFIHQLTPGGSVRRWSPTVGDIDVLATSSRPEEAMDGFVSLSAVAQVLGHGATKSTILTDSGLQVDLRIVPDAQYGSLLQHFTGSKQHNIELREYALARGLSLNEYGITDQRSGTTREFRTEEEFYGALGLPWMPPELREGTGEIQAAASGTLPRLVTTADIRGDLHVHSTWSDGTASIEAMARAAMERGYEYIAMTDHSAGIGVANGLSVERILEQLEVIRELNRRLEGFTVLTGTELEIKRNGELDFPDAVLAKLDWVIASIHSGFNQSEEQMTARMVRAIENPHVDCIAHPTGRLIGKREPYAVNLEAVFRAAARTGTLLEINSFPERLDLVDAHARRAIELGVTLVVNTDAHAPVHFDNLRFGIAMARRGWAEPVEVANTLGLPALLDRVRRASPSP
jgi:DNA polymerase (family 10)